MGDSDMTDEQILARLERRRSMARDRYRKLRQMEINAERRAQISATSGNPHLNDCDRVLLETLVGSTSHMRPRNKAIAEHILLSVLDLGSPFKGWQDDARNALSAIAS